MRIHLDLDYRNDQNPGDDFSLYIAGTDGFYLNRGEVRELLHRLDDALRAHRGACEALGLKVEDE